MGNTPDPRHWSSEPFVVFNQRVLLATGIVIGVLLLLVVLWYALDVLLLAFAGILLAILLRTLSDWVARRTSLSEGWSLGAVLALLLALMVGVGAVAAAPISEQIDELTEQVPESLQELREWLGEYALGRWLVEATPSPDDFGENGETLMQLTGIAYTTFGVVFSFFIILFVTLYLAVNPALYTAGMLRLVPQGLRPRTAEIIGATGYTLRWWLIATLIKMTAVGGLTMGGLWLLGIPLAFLLGLLAFFLDFVPYFGPIIAAVPAVLLAFTEGPQQALYVVLLYVAIQQIESLVLSPLIYHRTVYLPPVVTILAQVLLGIMAGPLGLVLATPLTAGVLVWVKMLYVEQVLGDRIDTPDEHIGPEDQPSLPEPHIRDSAEGKEHVHARQEKSGSSGFG